MSKDKSNKGILDGMLGAMIFHRLNSIFQSNKEKNGYEDWDDQFERIVFDSFSNQANKKLEGYKLKYDIDESKIKTKSLNLIPINEYLHSLQIDYDKNKDTIEYSELAESWKIRKWQINNILRNNIHKTLIAIDTTKPKYWVYSIKEKDDLMKITITNREEGKLSKQENEFLNNSYIYDDYICLEKDEAQKLAKEMKRYYHNYIERIVILEDLGVSSDINKSEYRANIVDLIPNYFRILEMINNINQPKYIMISSLLEETSLEDPLYILLNCFSLGIQLQKDGYYQDSIFIFKSLLNSDKTLLTESGLENKIYEKIIYLYLDLKLEKEIIELIENRYNEDYHFMNIIAKELYDLELYKAADRAYRVIIENEDLITFNRNVFEAYLRTQNDEGMKIWREKLSSRGKDTWEIDRYLKDEDIEGLKIKIFKCEEEKDWAGVINYCNKYNKLILLHPWRTMEDRVDYEFKKLDAYMKSNKYTEAWNSSCKTRSLLISNFNGVNYFKYLSKVESYMSDICLKQNYLIDNIYHYIMMYIYDDIFTFYNNHNELNLDWDRDLFLQDIIEKAGLEKTWNKIEKVIRYEYGNISKKTLRNINIQINNILEEDNFHLILDKPEKYFPNKIPRDFNID